MEEKSKQKTSWTEAWNKGVEIGLDFNQAKEDMRVIIANRVKSCRKSANLTQAELSEKINVNSLTYRGYENCRSDIPIVYLVRIADTLKVSMDYLTGRTDSEDGTKEDTTKERLEQLEKAVAALTAQRQ